MDTVLTKKEFKLLEHDAVFSRGVLEDSNEGVCIEGTNKRLHWVAKKGKINDWAVYVQHPYWDEDGPWVSSLRKQEYIEYIIFPYKKTETHGCKLTDKKQIQNLVPCTDEVFEMYRY